MLLDPARFAHELARRGITQRQLAEVAGVPASTISRARHGRQLAERTLNKLMAALREFPMLDGVELLIQGPPR